MDSDSSYVEDSDGDLESTIPPRLVRSSPPRPRQEWPESTIPTQSIIASGQGTGGGDNNDEDAPSYFTRPNRYFGPASTWRSWTEQERTVALSLDRVRSQDLSVHLFNAFWLKRKAGEVERTPKRRKLSSKGKERATGSFEVSATDDGGLTSGVDEQPRIGGQQRSTLPRSWTAWPLPPDQVPRDELLPRVDAPGAWRATATAVDMRPSADLEGWLIAIAQKMARERWSSREWEDEDAKNAVRGHGTSGQQGTDSEVESASDAEESEEAESGSDIDDEEQHDPGIPLFSSQAVSPLGSDEDEVEEEAGKDSIRTLDENDDKDHRRPVPLADDEKARQYFLPSARHILSGLDRLLFGLHNARRAYAQKPQGKPRGRRLTSSRSRSRSRIFQDRPTTTDEEEEEDEDEDEDEERRGRRSRRSSSASSVVSSTSRFRTRPRTRTDRFNPRDWSDVVGMAALTGWDASIVERASERCARLFGENMLFRTFHEGGEAKDESNTSTTVKGRHQSQSYFTEFLAMETTSGDSSAEADAENQVATTSTQYIDICNMEICNKDLEVSVDVYSRAKSVKTPRQIVQASPCGTKTKGALDAVHTTRVRDMRSRFANSTISKDIWTLCTDTITAVNHPLFRSVEITYIPIFLGGLLKACNNRAPLEIKNKDKWINIERLRWARQFDIPISSATPEGFPKPTIQAMRFLTALQMVRPDLVPLALDTLYAIIWTDDGYKLRQDDQKPQSAGGDTGPVSDDRETESNEPV
ncbi:hypothetical protein KCU88_g1452, partial [Aureobasidium melanogenum]